MATLTSVVMLLTVFAQAVPASAVPSLVAPTPTITGTAAVGQLLKANSGAWGPSPVTLKYQWYRSSAAIAKATGSSYKVTKADTGRSLTVRVTGTKAKFKSVTRVSLGATVGSVFLTTRTPTISGTPTVGSALTATSLSWSPAAGLRYQWNRRGVPIPGATRSSYALGSADGGTLISVTTIASAKGRATTTRTSGSMTVAKKFARTSAPTISGTARVGSTLTAKLATWSPAPRFSYQWLRNGTAIAGATASTYTLVAADAGAVLTIRVTGRAAGYTPVSRSSAGIGVVGEFTRIPTPTISGSATYGSTLTANPGTWGVPSVHFSYQWRSNGIVVGGATAITYHVSASDIGHTISVDVTAAAPGYQSRAVTSSRTPAVPTPPVTGTTATRTQRMSRSTLNSNQNGWYEQGRVLTLVCYQRGQSVKGYFSSSFPNGGWDNLWYRVNDGMYVADVDLETGTLDPVTPACPDQPVADTTNATVKVTTQRMSDATLNSSQSGTYGPGARLTLVCYRRGQSVQGYFSGSFPGGWDNLWYKVSDGFWVADVDIETGSNDPVTPACSTPAPPPISGDLVTRARSWLDARVPYNQGKYYTNQYGTYRQDCSGFVSMALGLSSSYVTGTLPQVMHPISKDELQPGDFMLNSAAGNNGHVAIFMGWTDAGHTHYRSWEENGAVGYAFEQVVPYPYWPSWAGSANYRPYRRN